MIKKNRWLGLILILILVTAALFPGNAYALPPGAPKTGMVCTLGSAVGGVHTFNLIANTGYIQTPDGNTVFMWSFANGDAPDNGAFQSPGPVLCVTQGETVVVNLTNNIGGPQAEPVSVIFPGQDSQVTASGGVAGLFTREAATGGGAVSYSFTASQPGTYIYQSGSDVSKQVEMGLYGALIVRPAANPAFAYDASTQFDPTREYMLLLAEIDPALHHAVELGNPYDFTTLHNRYFTINGRSFPDTILENGTSLLPAQPYGAMVRIQPNTAVNPYPALIRMLNVGADNHPFHPHGNHTRQVAQDGRPIKITGSDASTEHFGETIGAGQTEDFLLRWDNQTTDSAGLNFNDNWDPNSNPLPVAQPNYTNLTFKGGNTWYSGSPYLGYKGTLPTGVVSQNICGEWYFPFHSHALNEFSNYDEGFGGMGTLLRVDPAGGCFSFPAATAIVGGVLKSGSVSALGVNDSTYYQVNPKTTSLTSSRTAAQTSLAVASAAGFPAAGSFYIRVDSEVMQVTGGQGTATWTVARGQLGTSAASHASAAVVSALANDWYVSFSNIKAEAANLRVTYRGKDCTGTTGSSCAALTTNLPQMTVKICDWTISGAAGCASATSNGWVTLPAPPTQPQSIGSTEPAPSTWMLSGLASQYIGTGANLGQVRVLVHTQRWTASNPVTFSTWANLVSITYDLP